MANLLSISFANSCFLLVLSFTTQSEYVFISENNILYAIGFEYDDSIRYGAFWLNIINRSQKKSPNDKKLQYTIICVIEEFFRVNPNILLYVCI